MNDWWCHLVRWFSHKLPWPIPGFSSPMFEATGGTSKISFDCVLPILNTSFNTDNQRIFWEDTGIISIVEISSQYQYYPKTIFPLYPHCSIILLVTSTKNHRVDAQTTKDFRPNRDPIVTRWVNLLRVIFIPCYPWCPLIIPMIMVHLNENHIKY